MWPICEMEGSAFLGWVSSNEKIPGRLDLISQSMKMGSGICCPSRWLIGLRNKLSNASVVLQHTSKSREEAVIHSSPKKM